MPRAGWVKPESERRLSDLVSVGVLTRMFPPALVDEVIAEAGRTEQRHRSLPARMMAYFSIGMALHSEGSYEDVLALLTDGLSWSSGGRRRWCCRRSRRSSRPGPGWGPSRWRRCSARVARPLATASTPGSWLAGRRLMAIDGTCLDVADTAENDDWFGRPGVNKGERAAFPQARGWSGWPSAAPTPCSTPKSARTRRRRTRWPAADRPARAGDGGARRPRVLRVPVVAQAAATGADLLWRAMPNMNPDHIDDARRRDVAGRAASAGNAGRHAEGVDRSG